MDEYIVNIIVLWLVKEVERQLVVPVFQVRLFNSPPQGLKHSLCTAH